MKGAVTKADPSKIERLADELSLRDLHVTLAPDGNNELVLEVINSRLDLMGAVRAGRVCWRDGAFWWSRLGEPERLPERRPGGTVLNFRDVCPLAGDSTGRSSWCMWPLRCASSAAGTVSCRRSGRAGPGGRAERGSGRRAGRWGRFRWRGACRSAGSRYRR